MALWSTSCRGERHGLGKEGKRGRERKGKADGYGKGQGTEKGEAYGSEEDNGDRKQKGVRWWGTQRSTWSPTREGVPIIFGTYNIRNGRSGGLESELRGMAQDNMDLGIFQVTKCTDGIYTRASAGYSVVATDAPIRHCGGVEVSTSRHHILRWRLCGSLVPTSSASS